MHSLMKELYDYYANHFLPPTTLIQVDIFWNDDVILEKLEVRSEFPRSNKNKLVAWFMQHHAYFGEEIYKDDEDILG